MDWQKCSGIKRSYLEIVYGEHYNLEEHSPFSFLKGLRC